VSLFASPQEPQVFDLAGGGRVVLRRGWMSPEWRAELFWYLNRFVDWQQRTFTMHGREVKQPRLTAWWGDRGASYVYSGIRNEPQPWPDWMRDVRARIEDVVMLHFNSCLGNLYRDGNDSVALHADDEPEIGPEPTIASLSLGASRKFQLRHATAAPIDLMLDDGDLLVMSGPMQREWKHGVPKMKCTGPRVNLTFRWVEAK
jgi:alkylated DNA repair dioxygenase AlkB